MAGIKEVKPLDGMAIEFGNRKAGRITRGKKDGRVNKPEKRQFKGHEFEPRFTSDSKNKAKREAQKSRKRGFYTRVIDLYPGVFPYIAAPKELVREYPIEGSTKY